MAASTDLEVQPENRSPQIPVGFASGVTTKDQQSLLEKGHDNISDDGDDMSQEMQGNTG